MKGFFNNWKGDLFGGVTAGVVALPLALAFGVASGMGPAAGLYGAAALGIMAALFGGTPAQISGPTGPMTVIAAEVVAAHMRVSGEAGVPLIFTTFLLAGLFQIILGVSRVGVYIRYMPYPVISGFMTGIGVIIIVLQLFPLTGHTSPSSNPLQILIDLPQIAAQPNWHAVALASATIGIIYLPSRLFFGFPKSLFAMLVVSLSAYFLSIDAPMIGNIPQGLPGIVPPSLSLQSIQLASVPAMQLAMLGAIDSLLTSVVADNLTKTRHDSNRELIGQGIGNAAASLVGGIPGAGATMRSVVNIQAGGRNRLSGVIHGLVLLAVLTGAGPLAARIPKAVLAGILITVGLSIIDYRGLRQLMKVPRVDAFLMLFVLGLTVLADLITAVGAGVMLASLLFMKKVADVMAAHTKAVPLQAVSRADEIDLPPEVLDNVLIKHIDGPLFFGFASEFQVLMRRLHDAHTVIIRFSGLPYIDQSGIYALEEACLDLKASGVCVKLCELRPEPAASLRKIGLIPDVVSEKDVHPTFAECIASFATRPPEEAPGSR